MYHISEVNIEGFWGKYNASTTFKSDVNILIGKNGTGKTTFMDMLQAVLRVDMPSLLTLEFDLIKIVMRYKSKQRTISVRKMRDEERPYDTIVYKIGNNSYHLALTPRDIDNYRLFTQRPTRAAARYFEVKRAVDKLVNIASLSVYRISYDQYVDDDDSPRPYRRSSEKPIIDRRLEQLSLALTKYQLSLADQEKDVSSEFQRDVLISMLFDPKFDTLNFEDAMKTELAEEKIQLTRAYQELGVSDENTVKKIDSHFDALLKSLEDVRTYLLTSLKPEEGEEKLLQIDSILPLPLLRRTQHIIDLSVKAERRKQEISRPIQQFLKLAGEFMSDKLLSIDSSTGALDVIKEDRALELLELSSGEKQLLILLIETLLQKNEPFIFLADEPEISLHIEWQAKVITSIRRLNASAQIIVATHSPEIAGSWRDYIIDMEDIIYGKK